MPKQEWVEKEVQEHNERVYQGEMPSANREVLRVILGKEHDFWEREAVREDSNSVHDDN